MDCRNENSLKTEKRIKHKCDYCGKEFLALGSRVKNNKVGTYCSHKCSTDDHKNGKIVSCLNCGKDVYKPNSDKYINSFCSDKCQKEFNKNNAGVEKICKYCNKKYKIKKSHSENSNFCSKNCKNKWMSENWIGENSPHYEKIECYCVNCNNKVLADKSTIAKNNNIFCSRKCSIEYYSDINNCSEKQKIARKNFLENQILYTKETLTKPHIKINKFLKDKIINFENEKFIKFYKHDIFLSDYNLAIEINGDYWHCNPNKYKIIEYKQQRECIRKDKSKHKYVKNKYGYEILYLWESDINKNFNICKNLIFKYIETNGVLENYHSFNYEIGENNELKLKEKLITPYQQIDLEDLKKLYKIKN
jgi:endogenous inhibitor of DNA gyrase (YacG/DUF329 family)/G:T-mismatch repair DNA endonuclease (very short patch repair protein)